MVYLVAIRPNDTLTTLVICFASAAFLCVIGWTFWQNTAGRLIRALLSCGATNEESAKTLEELGIRSRFPLGFLLRKRSTLRRTILLTALPDNDEKKRLGAKFYLASERLEFAEKRFGKNDAGVWPVIVVLLLLAIVTALALIWGPYLLAFFQGKL